MNKRVKKILFFVAALLVLFFIASKMGWIGKKHATKVAVSKVEDREIIETVSASGKIQPEIQVKLSPEVSGEIVELTVREGDIVKKGQLLCKIKPDILVSGYERSVASYNAQKASVGTAQQQIIQADANFKNLEARYKRNLTLYKDKVISASEFDAVNAEYLTAKANLESAKQGLVGARFNLEQTGAAVKEASDNLARTNIYAPVDGVVSKLSVEKGERVVGTAQMSGTEIMTIADLSSMEVKVNVNENDINRLSVGDTSIIEVDAFLGKKFKGLVTEIASSATLTGESVDQVTNFAVKVKILPESYADVLQKTKLPSPFRPGLSATVDIQTNRKKGLVVPIQAVTVRDNERQNKESADNEVKEQGTKPKVKSQEYVFIIENGKAKQVEVKSGIQDNQFILIEGLQKNQQVISAPYSAISKDLKDGDPVEIVDKSQLFGDVKK